MPTATKSRRNANGYMKLIKDFPLRKLETESDYSMAMRMVSENSDGRKKLDKGSLQYLQVLVDLIVEYEKNAGHQIDTSDIGPGDIVKHLAEENGLTLTELAMEIGIGQSNLSEMVSGKRDQSKKAIVGLCADFLWMRCSFWSHKFRDGA